MSADQKYGLIGKMIALPGKRDELSKILVEGVAGGMPGCLSYVVAADSASEDALWITEVWESQEKHRESLELESVQRTIARGRPLIAGFGERFETHPRGGFGLVAG
ncbi:MAG: antibiotic biosynthesis monooxygenase [Acidobacteriota bacterium]